MNIGINLIGAVSRRSGGRVYAKNIVNGLARTDHENTYYLFISSPREDFYDQARRENFKRVFCCGIAERRDSLKVLAEQTLLPLAFLRAPLDVLYSPVNELPLLGGPKSVLVVHDLRFFAPPVDSPAAPMPNRDRAYDTLLRRTLKRGMFSFFLKKATRLVAISRETARDITQYTGTPAGKISVIPDPVDLDMFGARANDSDARLRKYRIPADAPYILFVSGMFPRKNVETLIRAFATARRDKTAPRILVLAGRVDEEYAPRLAALVRDLNIASDVIFTGYVEEEDLPTLYRHATVFAFPSLFEGFGIPLVEAMASGVPVVAVRASTSPEVLGDAGALVPNSPEALAEGILTVCRDDTLRQALIRKGTERAKLFAKEAVAAQTLKLIQNTYNSAV